MTIRSGSVERVAAVAARLSWQLALALAAASFILLHMLASQRRWGSAATLAFALQFIVPLLCILIALLRLLRGGAALPASEMIASTEASAEACDTQRVAIVRAIEAQREIELHPLRRRGDRKEAST